MPVFCLVFFLTYILRILYFSIVFVLFCVLSLPLYTAASFLFSYKSTDHCHRAGHPIAVNKYHIKRVVPAKCTGCATESLQWKTGCHRVRSKGADNPGGQAAPCILLGWSQRRATRLTRTTVSEAHNQREDKEMEETEENRGSDGDPIFMRKTMCFKTEKFLVQVYGLRW